MLERGQVVQGRFRVHDIVGHGRASTVYRAHDKTTNRDVVVKVADWDIGSPTDADTPVLPLRHPNIVGVHSITPLPVGRTSIAMELVKGGHLASMLKHGPLKPDWARFVMEQTARALAHAHEQGVVHGDIRPENIVLIQPELGREQVKIAGYDGALVARLSGPGRGPERGASPFAAPEQRHTGRASAASDVYSLASTVWVATTGLSHKDDRAHTVAAAIPEDLRQVLWRCLSPLPGDRYADGAALLAAIVRPEFADSLVSQDRPVVVHTSTSNGTALGVIMVSAVTLAAMSVVMVGVLVGQQMTAPGSVMTVDPRNTPVIGVDSGVAAGGVVATAPAEPVGSLAPTGPVTSAQVDPAPVSEADAITEQAAPARVAAPAPSAAAPGPSLSAPVPTPKATAPASARPAPSAGPAPQPTPAPVTSRPAPKPAVVATPTPIPVSRVPAVVSSKPVPAAVAERAVDPPAAPPSVGEAPAPSPMKALVGVTSWQGDLDGKDATMSLSIAPDGTVYGTVRGSGLAGSYARGVFGSAEVRDGTVHIDILETRRTRPRAFEGTLTPTGGQGTVSVNGRDRGAWTMAPTVTAD